MDASSDDDVQIMKVTSAKKSISWVSSSFDDLGFKPKPSIKSFTVPKTGLKPSQQDREGTSEIRSLKRSREQANQPKRIEMKRDISFQATLNSELWSEKYKPSSREELVVHKKKVEVIADWLNQSLQHVTKKKTPILLLTGPPGAGKTACIHVLCAELGIDIQVWSSTSEQAADQWSEEGFISGEKSRVDVYMSQSQSALFNNFLLRANKYHALDLSGPVQSSDKPPTLTSCSNMKEKKTAILVEDIPNIFYRDTQKFHDILRKYTYSGHCPLLFIMSESNNNSCTVYKLFPKDLQHQLGITNISLNPVAPTVLVKLLTSVVSKEARLGRFYLPSSSVIEMIAASSCGDVRSAINALQFACRSDTADLKSLMATNTKDKKKKKGPVSRLKNEPNCSSKKDSNQSDVRHSLLGVKDTSVFLFHSVGKILYFKRGDPKDYPNHQKLSAHLKEHDRDPLLCDPEDVAHKSNLSGDYFNSFLHENYVDFLSCVEDLERAAAYFSDADYMSALWVAREELQNYSLSVATRGYIYSSSECSRHDSSRKMSWRPLHRSQWFNVSKQVGENIITARQLFKGYHWEPEVLCTEILPYISLTNPTLHDTGQISFVQKMTHFSQFKAMFRSHQDRLDEKDVVTENENDEDSKTATESRQLNSGEISDIIAYKTLNDEDVDVNTISQSQTKVQDLNIDDEVVIEDFDDEI